ncbi:asparagine synthetase B family protein [Lysinibacillus sp. NPDC056959]|uniref:asparagine synthetase B family protein n=1 Tax=Lysinibacillus sp. NPDC056959 TaxID=3345981 RepID=UPI003631EC65
MCGIFGIIGNHVKDNINSDSFIKLIEESLLHRGPDYQNFIIQNNFIFYSARLAVKDPRAIANQPYFSNSNNWILLFNGEVTNHECLRQKLKFKDWNTQSDTETISVGLEEEGIDFLKKLNGMFAIAAFNVLENKIYLYRDYPGIKPLYFSLSIHGYLVFSSEFPSLLNVLRELSGNIYVKSEDLMEYLLYRNTILEPETLIGDIRKLSPGELLEYDLKSNRIQTIYQQREEYNNNFNSGMTLEEAFAKSITNNIVKGTKMGMLLSGGVDSSAVMAKCINEGANIEAFTLQYESFGEYSFSELPFSKYVCNHFSIPLHEITLTEKEFLELLPTAISKQDGMSMDPTIVAYHRLGKEMHSKGIITSLSGTGSDEVFGSYEWLHASSIEEFDEWMRMPFVSDFLNFRGGNIDDISHKAKKKRKRIIGEFTGKKDLSYGLRQFGMLHLEADALPRVDLGTMYSGVECRVPLLDQTLIKKAFSESPDENKELIRNLSKDYLPSVINNRKKCGFPHPVFFWMKYGELSKVAFNQIINGPLKEYINTKEIIDCFESKQSLMDKTKESIVLYAKFKTLWYIFAVSLWCEKNSIKIV